MDTITFGIGIVENSRQGEPGVTVFVNGLSMIELVRQVELPFATAEGDPRKAGQYDWLPLRYLRDAWGHFHGAPFQYGKTIVLGCPCGVSECWPLLVRIEVGAEQVAWRLFEQPYRRKKYETEWNARYKSRRVRHWTYKGLGPFTFERGQYESALRDLVNEAARPAT